MVKERRKYPNTGETGRGNEKMFEQIDRGEEDEIKECSNKRRGQRKEKMLK